MRDNLMETLREWVAAGNPGLVSRADLAELEERLDELGELLDEIEEKLQAQHDPSTSSG